MDALTPESELRLRAELEQQIASLKAALENMKAESDRWRTIAERRALPERRTESAPATRWESREWWWKLMG